MCDSRMARRETANPAGAFARGGRTQRTWRSKQKPKHRNLPSRAMLIIDASPPLRRSQALSGMVTEKRSNKEAVSPGRHPTFEYLPACSPSPIFVTAEHAGVKVPKQLNRLGLPVDELKRHIGWDIGVDGVAREVHRILGIPTLLGRFSRLLVDLNRAPESPACIRESSDGTAVPANQRMSKKARSDRIEWFHQPYHEACSMLIRAIKPKALLSIHSYTPRLRVDGFDRPWHCAVLYGRAWGLARECIEYLESVGDFIVGDNTPYRIGTTGVYSLPVHGDEIDIPMIVVEIRQDLIADAESQRKWGRIISGMAWACLPMAADSANNRARAPKAADPIRTRLAGH